MLRLTVITDYAKELRNNIRVCLTIVYGILIVLGGEITYWYVQQYIQTGIESREKHMLCFNNGKEKGRRVSGRQIAAERC